jgi:multiple sugar transport system ATP-binding protein
MATTGSKSARTPNEFVATPVDLAGVATEAPYAIELVGVTKRYGSTTALADINLEIGAGEFCVLLGPSGCGKSTILKVIAGLEDATAGEIYINGKLANYVRPKERDVAMVFQNYALYPHMTVETNIGFPLKMRGTPKAEVTRRVGQIGELLELADHLQRYPEQLSGGQRQRVALGRAIIREPVAFLMDEPLSNLDALLRVQMRTELLKLHREVGRTTVYVTHDQVEAMTMANRIVVLKSGIVQQVGTTHEVYARPANTFVATFVGSPQMNLFKGTIGSSDAQPVFRGHVVVPLVERFVGLTAGSEVTLGIRPEDIVLAGSSEPGALPGSVDLVETIGADNYVTLALGQAATCIIRTSGKTVIQEGEQVHVRFPSEGLHFFDSQGIRVPLHGEGK